jgi:putative transposase
MTIFLSHKIRLDPKSWQEDYFRRACGVARFTYNWALEKGEELYARGEWPNGRKLRTLFNSIRWKEFPWTGEVAKDCSGQAFINLQTAYTNYFKGYAKRPVFKKRGKRDSFYIANDKFSIRGKRVRIPKLGEVKMREHLRWVGKIMGATVSRTADEWYISFRIEMPDFTRPRTGEGRVGVDLGIKTSVKLSTGESIEGPKAYKASIEKERRLSRRLSRKQKGSKNQEKAKVRLARARARTARIRADFLHKLTSRLCSENQAIGIEDLNVAGMLKNHKLARAIQDEGWGEFRRQLTYKAPLWGTELVVKDRFFASSKLCSWCGYKNNALTLKDRFWVCPDCGTEHDRDFNASINLIPGVNRESTPVEMGALAGQAVCPVKLPSVKQEFQVCDE